jgi:hypothetical protein
MPLFYDQLIAAARFCMLPEKHRHAGLLAGNAWKADLVEQATEPDFTANDWVVMDVSVRHDGELVAVFQLCDGPQAQLCPSPFWASVDNVLIQYELMHGPTDEEIDQLVAVARFYALPKSLQDRGLLAGNPWQPLGTNADTEETDMVTSSIHDVNAPEMQNLPRPTAKETIMNETYKVKVLPSNWRSEKPDLRAVPNTIIAVVQEAISSDPPACREGMPVGTHIMLRPSPILVMDMAVDALKPADHREQINQLVDAMDLVADPKQTLEGVVAFAVTHIKSLSSRRKTLLEQMSAQFLRISNEMQRANQAADAAGRANTNLQELERHHKQQVGDLLDELQQVRRQLAQLKNKKP